MCQVTNAKDFLKTLLPVYDDDIDNILADMIAIGVYSGDRWADFSRAEDGPKENAIYKAFIKVVNIIHKAAVALKTRSQGDFPESEYLGASDWVDQHAKAPISHSETTAQVRPDACLVLRPSTLEQSGLEKEATSSSPTVRWSEALAAVEMKRSDPENLKEREETIKQLIGYLLLILREQIDRRFVFGFTLGPSKMIVLLHDRSGVLATEESIDIHKDPKAFIRVIAAFVLLPAHKLGFDPSMKLYNPVTKIATPRYKLIGATYNDQHSNMQWVINMNNGDEYLTVKTLSLTSMAFRHGGRGTIVWAVVPYSTSYSDFEASEDDDAKTSAGSSPESDQALIVDEEPQVFVLKQSWKPVEIEGEGYFYDFAQASKCDKIAALVYEETTINGEKDETDKLIRQSLKSKCFPASPLGTKRPRPEEADDQIHIKSTDRETQPDAVDTEGVVYRVHTKTLIKRRGFPLKFFSGEGELIRSMGNAIEGHKHLYMNGVLHRDISAGNIIIVKKPAPGTTNAASSYGGCLIDLDRAKAGQLSTPLTQIPDAEHREHALKLSDSAIERQALFVKEGVEDAGVDDGANLVISPEAVRYANSLHLSRGDSQNYLLEAVIHAIIFHHVPESGALSPASLHWNQITKHYDFANELSNDPEQNSRTPTRTGTPPFASYEILSGTSYFLDENPQHDAIHDIESFFWVLVHLCMTRQGPGGQRRDELKVNTKPRKTLSGRGHHSLHTLVWCMFYSEEHSVLAESKRRILRSPENFENWVMANFQPSFRPFEHLVREWYSLLRLAYKFHGYEYHNIHDLTLAIFNNFIKSQGSELDRIGDVGKTVLESREADILRCKKLGAVTDSMVNEWGISPRGKSSQTRPTMGTPPSPSSHLAKRIRMDAQKDTRHLNTSR